MKKFKSIVLSIVLCMTFIGSSNILSTEAAVVPTVASSPPSMQSSPIPVAATVAPSTAKTNYHDKISTITFQGVEYTRGQTVTINNGSKHQNINSNSFTQMKLNDGTVLTSPYPFGLSFLKDSKSENGATIYTTVLRMIEGGSYYSLLTVNQVCKKEGKKPVKESSPFITEVISDYDPVGDGFLGWEGPKWKLSKLLRNKEQAKKASFKSLNTKLFSVKNGKIVINKRKESEGYYWGAGYLQVNVSGAEIGKVMVVVFPHCAYHDNWYAQIKSVTRTKRNALRLRFLYPGKNVTNVKGFKFKYRVCVKNGAQKGKNEGVGKYFDLYVPKGKNVKITLAWSTNFVTSDGNLVTTYSSTMRDRIGYTFKWKAIKKMKMKKKYSSAKRLRRFKIDPYSV